jgi:lipopolysaccharide transport system permease protein
MDVMAEAVEISAAHADAAERSIRPLTVISPPALSWQLAWRSVRMLPRYADLLYTLTAHRIKVRYKQSLLGPAWAIAQPLAMMLVFAAVFSTIVRVPTNGHPFPVFAYSGLLPWTAFAAAVGSASTSLVAHASLVTRVYFPREILPITYIAAAVFDLAVASTVLLAMVLYYQVAVTPALLWIVPILILLAGVALAVSLMLCAIHARYRDVGVAMPLLLQIWFFASPVIYPLTAVPASWRRVYTLNPMAGIVDGFRSAVLEGRTPDLAALGSALAIVAVGLPFAYLWFKHVDATMADLV